MITSVCNIWQIREGAGDTSTDRAGNKKQSNRKGRRRGSVGLTLWHAYLKGCHPLSYTILFLLQSPNMSHNTDENKGFTIQFKSKARIKDSKQGEKEKKRGGEMRSDRTYNDAYNVYVHCVEKYFN